MIRRSLRWCWSAPFCRPAGDQVYVVRTSKFSQGTRRCLVTCPNCEGTILCQLGSLSTTQHLFLCWSSGLYVRATLESLVRYPYSNPSLRASSYRLNPKLNSLLFFSGLWDKLELSGGRDRLRVFETRFRAGFNFATTRSSSPPCFRSCICLFDIGWGSSVWFLKWLQENMELLMMLNWQRWMVPFTTYATAFRQNVGELVFCYQRIWFSLWDPSWFCQITNRARFCGFGTRVSSSDSCLEWSSRSQLHFSTSCTPTRIALFPGVENCVKIKQEAHHQELESTHVIIDLTDGQLITEFWALQWHCTTTRCSTASQNSVSHWHKDTQHHVLTPAFRKQPSKDTVSDE